MNIWMVIIPIVAAAIIFIAGFQIGLHYYAKKLLTKYYGGDLIIDISSIEAETLQVEFEKNPKELLGYKYVLMGVFIRE